MNTCNIEDLRHQLDRSKHDYDCIQCSPSKPDLKFETISGKSTPECFCDVGNGYVFKEATNICQRCSEGCLKCDQNLNCLICAEAKNLIQLDGRSCAPRCSPDEFLDGSTSPKRCRKIECNIQNCSRCDSRGSCEVCKTAYFLEPSSRTCKECPQGCSRCGPSGECQFCENHQFLQTDDQSCLKTCKTNEYKDFNLRKCKRCSEGCESCSDSSSCDYLIDFIVRSVYKPKGVKTLRFVVNLDSLHKQSLAKTEKITEHLLKEYKNIFEIEISIKSQKVTSY